jgi:hypothetical protein
MQIVHLVPRKNNKVITLLSGLIFKPLKSLDNYIKTETRLSAYYKKFFENFTTNANDSPVFMILYNCSLVIKTILLITFIIDVYFLHKLNFVYKLLPLSILLLSINYFIYSLKTFKKHIIEEVSPMIEKISIEHDESLIFFYGNYIMNVDPEDEEDREMYLTLENFVQFQMLLEYQRPGNYVGEYSFGIILEKTKKLQK